MSQVTFSVWTRTGTGSSVRTSPITIARWTSPQHVLEGDGAEQAVDRRQVGLDGAAHKHFLADAVADEVGHRHHLEVVLGSKLFKLGQPRHRPVRVHDLADDAGRIEARDTREVNDRLGLPGPDEDAALLGAQREDVSGARKVLRARLRVHGREDGGGAVGGRDACGDAFACLDGDGEGRAEERGVVGDLHRQVQLVAALLGQGHADEAAGVRRHEVDNLGRDQLGRTCEVALVLAVLIVHDDNHAAFAQVSGGLFDGGKGHNDF
jgi:hypothetical protein